MIIRYETNIPQRVTLKYAQGKEVEGQFGIQFLHGLLPEGQTYLSPVVEQKLAELEIRDGETVEICKREVREGNRKRTEWQVERVEGQKGSAPQPLRSSPDVSRQVENQQVQDIPSKLSMDRAMTMFLIAAGRSTREAEQVLGQEGGSVRFDSRDVCALATTCMIQAFKTGWAGWFEPRQAQAAVAEAKIQQLTNQRSAVSDQRSAPEFKPAASAWTTRGEMKDVFARLREIVGEVEFAKEMERAGVSSPAEFHYLNKARESYSRLVALAAKEAA